MMTASPSAREVSDSVATPTVLKHLAWAQQAASISTCCLPLEQSRSRSFVCRCPKEFQCLRACSSASDHGSERQMQRSVFSNGERERPGLLTLSLLPPLVSHGCFLVRLYYPPPVSERGTIPSSRGWSSTVLPFLGVSIVPTTSNEPNHGK